MVLAVVMAFMVTLSFDLSKWVGCWLAVILVLAGVWLTDCRGRVVRLKSFNADNATFEFKRGEYAQQFGHLNKTVSGVAAKERAPAS